LKATLYSIANARCAVVNVLSYLR